MFNATNNKSYGSGLTYLNEICKRIVSIIGDIIVFFYRWVLQHWVLWISDATSIFHSGLWKCFLPVAATYYVLKKYTMNIFLLVMDHFCIFCMITLPYGTVSGQISDLHLFDNMNILRICPKIHQFHIPPLSLFCV